MQILDPAGDVILTIRVYFISPQVDTSTQSVLAKAPVDQAADQLRSQQLVRARITWSTPPASSSITVTFELTRSLDIAAVDVQNSRFGVNGRLPNEVKTTAS